MRKWDSIVPHKCYLLEHRRGGLSQTLLSVQISYRIDDASSLSLKIENSFGNNEAGVQVTITDVLWRCDAVSAFGCATCSSCKKQQGIEANTCSVAIAPAKSTDIARLENEVFLLNFVKEQSEYERGNRKPERAVVRGFVPGLIERAKSVPQMSVPRLHSSFAVFLSRE